MTLFGVDVSHWQSNVAFPALASRSIDYVISKATDGLTTDTTYEEHLQGTLDAGLIAGSYHYLEAGDGAAQADYFIKVTGLRGTIFAVDCEAPGPTLATYQDFYDRFTQQTGKVLFTYSGLSYWKTHMKNGAIKGPLWLAFYPGNGYGGDASPIWNQPLGGVKPSIWQYGPGPFAYDGDAFRGTRDDLIQLAGSIEMLAITDEQDGIMNTPDNAPWLDLDGKTKLTQASQPYMGRYTPYGVGNLRAMYATIGGVRRVVLVKPTSYLATPTPVVVDCASQVSSAVATAKADAAAAQAAAVAAAVAATKASAKVTITFG